MCALEFRWSTLMEEVNSKEGYGGVQIEGSHGEELSKRLAWTWSMLLLTMMILLCPWLRGCWCCTIFIGCENHTFEQSMWCWRVKAMPIVIQVQGQSFDRKLHGQWKVKIVPSVIGCKDVPFSNVRGDWNIVSLFEFEKFKLRWRLLDLSLVFRFNRTGPLG